MKLPIITWSLIFLFTGCTGLLFADEGKWQDRFDRICEQTAVVGQLNNKELGKLINMSDELLEIIQASNDPKKKIYLLRLKKCRNLFVFMREIGERAPE